MSEKQTTKPDIKSETKPEKDVEITDVKEFDDMKLKPKLLRGIYAYGFEKPSQIQQRAILPIISSSRGFYSPLTYRRHRSSPIRYRKDWMFLHFSPSKFGF